LNNIKKALSIFVVIFLKELKHAFRDKDVLIYTVVVPAVLYPLLLVGGIEIFVMKQASGSRDVVNYAVIDGEKPKIRALNQLLARGKHYKLVESKDRLKDLFNGRIGFILDEVDVSAKNPRSQKPNGQKPTIECSTKVEAIVPSSFFDINKVDALNNELKTTYKVLLGDAFKKKGLDPLALEINKVEQKNVNPQKKELFSLTMALLFFSLFNVALGGAYPAIAATSEEFEHQTIETSLILPVNRWLFMLAKLCAVLCLALMAGSINLVSMYGDSSLAVMGAGAAPGVEVFRPNLSLTLAQAPLVLIAYFIIALLYSAIMLVTASFCRTVRASQQWVSLPMTVFMLVPFLAIIPQIDLSPVTDFIPLLNNLLVLRSLFNGESPNWMHLVASLQALLLVAIAMKVTAVMVFERFENKWRW